MSSQSHVRSIPSVAAAVQTLYEAGQSDYSLEPIVVVDAQGEPVGRIRDGDGVVFCCRRGEREIQLTDAFVDPNLNSFERRSFQNLNFIILTLYHEKFKDIPVAFAPSLIRDTLSEAVSRAHLTQLHTAESEKFAHVTFFFNGGNHQPFAGETDQGIPSPKGIPFDQVPQLSLAEVSQAVLTGIETKTDFILANFANGDVLGHSQNRAAKIRCAEIVDEHVGQVTTAALAQDYVVLITADHGNLEVLLTSDGAPHVAHTTNPVECLLLDPRASVHPRLKDGILADVAPTLLRALGVPQPEAMTGADLAPQHDWQGPRRVLLLVLDGWGIGSQDENDAIFLARTPVWDNLLQRWAHSRLQAAGEAVGLQPGKAGNSEAGHLNLGAGRVVEQDDVRLDRAMQDGSFFSNPILCQAITDLKQTGASLHLIGLLTEKSSHGSIDYPLALLRMAKAAGLNDVYLHLIFDGRSTEPGSAPALLARLEEHIQQIGIGQVVTGMGRAYALDRDGNTAKTKRAYDALVFGTGLRCSLV